MWFGASIFVAPVLLVTSVVGVLCARTGRIRREHLHAFVLLGGLALFLFAGFPVWMSQYAQ